MVIDLCAAIQQCHGIMTSQRTCSVCSDGDDFGGSVKHVCLALFLVILLAAHGHAALAVGRGTCAGGPCGAYTDSTEINGFTIDSNANLLFQTGTSATEWLRLSATGGLGLGTTTPKASVDFSAKTDGLILQTASAAAGAVCTSSLTGAVRYNSNIPAIEFCNGSTWSRTLTSTCDNSPTLPNFGDVYNLTTSTLTSSTIALVTGMDSGCNVTVGVSGTGGNPEYRVCSDAACSSVVQNWTKANNTLDMQGKYMQLRATSSASIGTAYTITATIGAIGAPWVMSPGISGCATIGTVCSDGTVYAGLSGASTPMYVTRCDAGQSWNGSACAGTRATYYWNNGNATGYTTTSQTGTTDGQTQTANLITLDSDSGVSGTQQHQAAQYCADLADSGYSDWFLPGSYELLTIYYNKTAIGNFDTSGARYWTSGENVNSTALRVQFSTYSYTDAGKATLYYVRCARR